VQYSGDLVAGFLNATQVAENGVGNGTLTSHTFLDDFPATSNEPANGFRAYRIRLVP